MIQTIWGVARQDLALWLRSPATIATALLPALGLGGLVAVLTTTIGLQPVALVQEGTGPQAARMADLLIADDEAYVVTHATREEAADALWQQRAAAVLVIPSDFDERMQSASAHVELFLNNIVDVDLSDDIRRTVTRSLSELDAPQLGVLSMRGARQGVKELVLPNPFRVAIAETDLRETDVGFLAYQLIPILVLILLSVGLLGTAMLIARDFERGTAKLWVAAPAAPAAIILGKLAGGVALAATLVAPLLALGAALGLLQPPPGHWPALLTLVVLLILLAVGLGLLLGLSVRRTQLTALVGLNGVAYLFFLGGGFSTVAFLPVWIQDLSRLVPTRYAIDGLRQVLFYPDLVGVGQDLLMLSLFTAGALLAGGLALRRTWRTA